MRNLFQKMFRGEISSLKDIFRILFFFFFFFRHRAKHLPVAFFEVTLRYAFPIVLFFFFV